MNSTTSVNIVMNYVYV